MEPEEKLTVEVYARASTLVETRLFQQEMKSRSMEMAGGQSFSSKTVRELHDLLSLQKVWADPGPPALRPSGPNPRRKRRQKILPQPQKIPHLRSSGCELRSAG